MATIDDLVKATRSKRVQVADLPDAPKLQPTVRSGGQYTVAVQQAGRNKLMDLADALSKVNPILQQYGAIQKAEREYQREQGELFAMEKPEEAMAELDAQRDKTKAELRKLREQGVIQEAFDPEFLLGIRAARAKVQAKEFRNQLLTDPELLQTDNPVGVAQERVGEFLSGLDSQYAKQQVAPLLDSIGNEFVNTVTRQQQDAAIAQGKTDWLNTIEDPMRSWVDNEAKLDDPVFKEWINDSAGAFKGNKEFSFNELIKPALLDLAERGNTAGALLKLQELKNWKINEKGAKFINATMQDSLNDIERTLINEGAFWRNQAIATYTNVKESAQEPHLAEFLQRLNDGKPVTTNYFNDWASRVREDLTEQGVKPSDIEVFIYKQKGIAESIHSRGGEKVEGDIKIYTGLVRGIDLGIDSEQQILEAHEDGLLSNAQFYKLLERNKTNLDFNAKVMTRDTIKSVSDIIENQFSDIRVEGGLPVAGLPPNKSNIIKDVLKIPISAMEAEGAMEAYDIPGVTLGLFRVEAMLRFKDALREERRRIITETEGRLTEEDMLSQMDKNAVKVYENILPQIKEDVKNGLKTGNYNIGFSKTQLDDYKAGKPVPYIQNILNALFEEGDDIGQRTFINNYFSKYIN